MNTLPTSDGANPDLVTDMTDLGPSRGETSIPVALAFYETPGCPPDYVVVASGPFAREGRPSGPVVFLHEDNPVSLLDGIFGSERSDGFARPRIGASKMRAAQSGGAAGVRLFPFGRGG